MLSAPTEDAARLVGLKFSAVSCSKYFYMQQVLIRQNSSFFVIGKAGVLWDLYVRVLMGEFQEMVCGKLSV